MKVLKNVLAVAVLCSVSAYGLADGHGKVHGLKDSANKTLAVAWIKAAYTGQAELAAMVKENMAAEGVFSPPRYVGFGFLFDPENDDEMVVARVTPDTPASKVLKAGDTFVSVAGVPATRENRDRLNFRGKPGQPVKAVIKRDGKEMPIEVRRGVISTYNSKDTALNNISMGDPEEWPVDRHEIDEVIGEGNVVYVVSNYTETEEDTGIEYTERVINRFVFDDAGKVIWAGSMGEDRFVLEQQGYTITR